MTQALNFAPPPMTSIEPTALPHLTTPGDVKEIVKYLRTKPGGVTIAEGIHASKRWLFEPRKVLAYELLGIVVRDGDHIRLGALGFELAQKLEPLVTTFREILGSSELYTSLLSWVYARQMEVIMDYEVTAYWRDNFTDAVGESDTVTLRSCAICFFNFCQEAGLGLTTIGTRGQPARFRVYRDKLRDHLESSVEIKSALAIEPPEIENPPADRRRTIRLLDSQSELNLSEGRMRVLISCASKTEIIEQTRALLEASGVECLIIERPLAGITTSEESLSAMRRCDAALIFITGEECVTEKNGGVLVNDTVLIELGAARALYGRRIALLWNSNLPIPSGLSGLIHKELPTDVLTWQVGIDLLHTVKLFRDSAHRAYA